MVNRPTLIAQKLSTRFVVKVAAPLVARANRRAVSKHRGASRHEPIFIVGPPRCGSTILYQALTNYFDVLYIDNLAARWAASLYLGMERSRRRYSDRPHANFDASYGDTRDAGGLHAPSECGALWYRWLDDDQHYIGHTDVTTRMVDELRDEITAIQNRWDRPLLIKNLHVGQRIAWVQRAFPHARYICLHRDDNDVIESIMRARERLNIPSDQLWSTRPMDAEYIPTLNERAMVAEQVRRITEQIESDLREIPEGFVRHLHYADLSADAVVQLGRWIGLERRPGGTLPTFGRRA